MNENLAGNEVKKFRKETCGKKWVENVKDSNDSVLKDVNDKRAVS